MSEKSINVHPTAEIHPTVLLEGNVTIGAYTKIDSGTIITGNVTIGHHTLIRCNVVIRGNNTIGSYVHIYDSVCIEGGRPARVGSSMAETPDRSIIGDECWINHGATMHGTQVADRYSLDGELGFLGDFGEGRLVRRIAHAVLRDGQHSEAASELRGGKLEDARRIIAPDHVVVFR